MGQRGTSIVKGDVAALLELLNKLYADEWLAYYQYWVGAKVVKGIMKDAVIAELNLHATEELAHALLVANRIVQLGGTPLLSPQEIITKSGCGYAAPTNFDVIEILKQNIAGERCAISEYSMLIDYVKEIDIITYDIAKTILAQEVEHEEDLQNLFEDIDGFINQYIVKS